MSHKEHAAQLRKFEQLCRRLSELSSDGATAYAEMYELRAAEAARLLVEGFTQADLNDLGGQLPRGLAWQTWREPMDLPPPTPWDVEWMSLHRQVGAVAMNLRTINAGFRRWL